MKNLGLFFFNLYPRKRNNVFARAQHTIAKPLVEKLTLLTMALVCLFDRQNASAFVENRPPYQNL